MFASGISVGDVSWPTSAQLPRRLVLVEGCCRASASLSGFVGQGSSGFVGQGSSGTAFQARLVGHCLSGKARRALLIGQGWKRMTSLTLKGAFVGP
ncbi:hypothetical protein ACFX12_037638 [Malus domestica]